MGRIVFAPFDGLAVTNDSSQDIWEITAGATNPVIIHGFELTSASIVAEIVDLRTIRPLDVETIVASVRKTNRCVIVEEGWPFCGVGAQVVDEIQRAAFDDLDAPVLRVTQADVPMPYAKSLEMLAKPSADRVVEACNQVLYR